MRVEAIVPILNVSDFAASRDWFARLGFEHGFAWCPPGAATPTFGAVQAGGHEIFLCEGAQGGRGADGVWMALWVDDVDAVHARCRRAGLDVIHGPADEEWHVREFHVRHPDGHVIRVSAAT